MASSSDNSVSGEEIDRVLGSTHDFVKAVHAGSPDCVICGQIRDAGERVLSKASSEAMEEFRRVSARYTEAKEDFRLARSSKKNCTGNYSAFHWAAEEGHVVIVQFLLGVDPKPDGNAKGDALYLAASEGHSHVVKALLDVLDVDPKVDVDAITGEQSTALCAAAYNGDVGVVEAVLKHPKVNVKEIARANNRFPLHEAATWGHAAVVEVLLKHPEFDVNRLDLRVGTPLNWAVQKGDIELVEVLLKQPSVDVNAINHRGATPLHVAVKEGYNRIVDVLLEHPSVDVNATSDGGSTPLHVAVCLASLNSVYSSSDPDKWPRCQQMDKYLEHLREAYVDSPRPRERNFWKTVQLFAKHIDVHKLDQEDNYSKSALEYAYESKDVSIWQVLSQAEAVKTYIEGLYKDRQVYVDAANAILVGAALIASVTFGSWLQPPLSYTFEGDGYSSQSSSSMPKYVDVEHNVALRVFWVFNCFSFYFAMATVLAGACSVLPRRKLFIKKIVQKLRQYLIATSLLLGCSVLCVIIAFGISGSIVLAPMLKFQSVMIVPTTIGGIICVIWLGILLKNILEDMELKDLQICFPRCFRKHK